MLPVFFLKELINNLASKAQASIERQHEKLKDKYISKMNEIRTLQLEISQLLRQHKTADDLRKEALERFHEMREKILIKEILIPHFQMCQDRKTQVFSPAALNSVVFAQGEYWKLLFYVMTVDDIDKAIAALPRDVGISRKEIDKKVTEINTKIMALKEELESELEANYQPDEI